MILRACPAVSTWTKCPFLSQIRRYHRQSQRSDRKLVLAMVKDGVFELCKSE